MGAIATQDVTPPASRSLIPRASKVIDGAIAGTSGVSVLEHDSERVVEHPLMAVAVRLMAEFPGHALTVLRVVADCADEYPEGDSEAVEEVARARLAALLESYDDQPPTKT